MKSMKISWLNAALDLEHLDEQYMFDIWQREN